MAIWQRVCNAIERKARPARALSFIVFALCGSPCVHADTTTLTIGLASKGTSNVPVKILFPVARSGDLHFDAKLTYHTSNFSAIAGTDYDATTGSIILPAGSSSATIPIVLKANTTSAANLSFGLSLDGRTGIGPATSFSPPQSVGTALGSSAVASADINGDGKYDLIAAVDTSQALVFLNTTDPGAATASFATPQAFDVKGVPEAIIAVDINGDGKPDLVSANFIDNSLSVLLNTTAAGAGTPSFATQKVLATGTGVFSVAAADLNGDGRKDLIAANIDDDNISVFLNTTPAGATTASFAARADFAAGNAPIAVTTADLNSDGKADLIAVDVNGGGVSVLRNTTSPGASVPTFSARQSFSTGLSPVSASVVDVDGDGRDDVIVANRDDRTISVLRNLSNAGGAPSFAAQRSFAAGVAPVGVVGADVNGDGKIDVIAINDHDDTFSVLLNNTALGASATPDFAAQQVFPGVSGPPVAVADINNDGKPDLVSVDGVNHAVVVLLNRTLPIEPTFTSSNFASGRTPQAVFAADINGDGKDDVVVANFSDANVSVQLNTTAAAAVVPTFGAAHTFATGRGPAFFVAADVNGDGKKDLIVPNNSDGTVSVLLNTTALGANTPSFSAQATFVTGAAATTAAATDVNGDGKPDIVVTNIVDDTVSVLINTTADGASAASFATQQTFAAGSSPWGVASADINNDGKNDLLIADLGGSGVAVLLNTTPPAAGTASFSGLQAFPTGAAPIGVTTADVNADGKADLIVSNPNNNTVAVLMNTTAAGAPTAAFGAFQAFASGGKTPFALATADINGDGKADLIVSNSESAAVAVLLNTTPTNADTPTFVAARAFTTGIDPESVVISDINGDGKPDLVSANPSADSFSVLLNTSAAITTKFTAQQAFNTGVSPGSVVTANIRGIGSPDLVVANTSDNTISVLPAFPTAPGSTMALFQTQQTFDAGDAPVSVTAADINGDGRPDVIAADASGGAVTVLLNATAPGNLAVAFETAQAFATGTRPVSVAAADLNGDGKIDLVAANFDSNTISLLRNTTAPGAVAATFAPQQTFATGAHPASVTTADINSDGMPDLIVANNGAHTVSVLLGTSAAGATTLTFATQHSFNTGNSPVSLVAADVNGDGRADLIVANAADDNVSVLLNTTAPGAATPTFGTQHTFAKTLNPQAVRVADVDGDGKNDLIVASAGDNRVIVLRNLTAPGASAPSFGSAQAFATGTEPDAVTAADLNGDGKPDLIVSNQADNTVSVLLNTQYLCALPFVQTTATIVHDYIFADGFE